MGLSFHDFEIGFRTNNLESILLADGYESQMLDWFPPNIEERTLMNYFLDKPIEKPLGFCRSVLNLMFVKPQEGASGKMLRHDSKFIHRIFKWHNFPKQAAKRLLDNT